MLLRGQCPRVCRGGYVRPKGCCDFRLLTFLPMLHTVDEYRWFIANVILEEFEVTVAEDNSAIVAFLARKGDEIRLLCTRPDRIGMGAGTQLIDAASCGLIRLEALQFECAVFTKREASVLSMARTTKSRCPMS